jgi:hypothetical protein
MFSYDHKLNYIVLCFAGFFVLATLGGGNAAKAVAAVIILATVSAIAYASFRILKVALRVAKPILKTLLLAILPEPKQAPATPVAKSAQRSDSGNQRITKAVSAHVKRQLSGDEICNVPAYARKEQNMYYPMTLEQLNRPKFAVVAADNGMSSQAAFAS